MAAPKNFKSIIDLVNDGKKYPAISLVKTNPEIAATISKLVNARDKSNLDNRTNERLAQTSRANFEQISADISEKTNDSESIMQLFPEMELGAQILVSSIISPKDMSGGDVIYTSPQGMLTPEVNASLISKIKDHFEVEYKLKPLLPKILREILFESGSYTLAVIPESSIDDMINGNSKITVESLSNYVGSDGVAKSFGILGDPIKPKLRSTAVGLEAFDDYRFHPNYEHNLTAIDTISKARTVIPNSNIRVVDNPFLLKLPKAASAANKNKVCEILKKKFSASKGIATESNKPELTDKQIQSLLYKSKTLKHNAVVKVPTKDTASRQTVGAPLVMRLPSESVIPVHVPGNEEEHIGFFVLIDINGNPVNKKDSANHFGDLQSKVGGSGSTGASMSSYLLDKATKGGAGGVNQSMTFDNAAKLYTDIVESDLAERLKNGVHGNNFSISKNQEVYRIMLARTLGNQTTQLLYLPAEIVTYFAYKYDENGVGKSLLDDMRILNSLRAMMMFSRVMASLKNSIGRTEVKLKLDEHDPDPNKTIETAIHEISKTRQQYFPLGLNSPTDLVDWIQRSGFEYTFEGHPKIPDMNIGFNEKATNYPKPDTELDDELKKRSIMGIGLSPETVDNGFTSEFATTVVSNNILLSKRVTQVQEHFSPLLTDHARKVVINNGTLVETLRATITENFDKLKESIDGNEDLEGASQDSIVDFLLHWFMNSFEIGLPQPSSVTLENQMASFDIYEAALDKAIEAWINSAMLNSDMAGNISGNADNIKGIIKAYYLRKWMADNNVLSELSELTSLDETGKPAIDLFEMQSEHINGLIRSSTKLLSKTKPMANAADKDIARITDGQGIDSTSSDTPSAPDDTGADDFDTGLDGDGDNAGSSNMDEPTEDPTAPKKDLPDLDSLP